MARIECPECGARYTVADDLIGKRVRCNECRAVIGATAPPPPAPPAAAPALPVARLLPPPPPDPPIPEASLAAPPVARRRADPADDRDEDDFDDRPRRPRKPKPPARGTSLLAVVGGGFVIVVVVVGMGLKIARKVDLVGKAGGEIAAGRPSPKPDTDKSLPEARAEFTTNLVRREAANQPLADPPPDLFRKVRYETPGGPFGAYLTPDPGDGQKHPAIVWITGGDCNSVDEVWKPGPPDNEQTASAYRRAGVVMMFPSLRGGNDNPGVKEGFLGEVDDVLAAADFLAKQSYVDPARVYLGGHSTGGTLVMLAAESSDKFRGVFSFGPADDVSGYGAASGFCPFDLRNRKEVDLRSPGRWLHSVKSPLFVFEGTLGGGNMVALLRMKQTSRNPLAHFYPVPGGSHFNILDPLNRLIAAKILADTGPTTTVGFTPDEVAAALRSPLALPTPAPSPEAIKPKLASPKPTAPTAELLKLTNPRAGKTKTDKASFLMDYELSGEEKPDPAVLVVVKTDGKTARSGVRPAGGWQPKGTLTLTAPAFSPGAEVWLARRPAAPNDEPERISNVLIVP